jgi:hypothetical protein
MSMKYWFVYIDDKKKSLRLAKVVCLEKQEEQVSPRSASKSGGYRLHCS